MRKNVNMNRASKVQLYNSIMESVTPEIRKALKEAEEEKEDNDDPKDVEGDDLEEQALNELFGFGSSVKKPEKALSLDNTDEENADLAIAWMAYYMSQASNNVQKGLEAFFKGCGNVIVKAPMALTKGILKLMSASAKFVANGVQNIGATVLGAISALARMTVSGVNGAQEALNQLYKTIKQGLITFYKNFTNKSDEMAKDAKNQLTVWLGVAAGALQACVNRIQGAAESLEAIFKQILADAKEKKDAAVLLVKTWLSCKSKEVAAWISSTAGDIKKTVVEAWNSMEKSVRKAYNNVAEKLESWIADITELVNAAKEKIQKAAEDAKSFTIDQKDKALIWGIQKGVKGLSNKYSEDQIVALVRKCFNEGLTINVNGKVFINEAYFYNKGSHQRRLYETRLRRNRK